MPKASRGATTAAANANERVLGKKAGKQGKPGGKPPGRPTLIVVIRSTQFSCMVARQPVVPCSTERRTDFKRNRKADAGREAEEGLVGAFGSL